MCGQAVNPELVESPEEAAFLARVRREADLDESDANDGLQDISKKFTSLSLVSCAWPLAAVVFLVGNLLRLRSDAFKICCNRKRPIPRRADSIGPWRDQLSAAAWLGCISSAVLVYLFNGDGSVNEVAFGNIQPTNLLLVIILSDHLYLLTRFIIRKALGQITSSGDNAEKYDLRKRLLEESFGRGLAVDEAIKKMEADTGFGDEPESEIGDAIAKYRFWQRQQALRDTKTSPSSSTQLRNENSES